MGKLHLDMLYGLTEFILLKSCKESLHDEGCRERAAVNASLGVLRGRCFPDSRTRSCGVWLCEVVLRRLPLVVCQDRAAVVLRGEDFLLFSFLEWSAHKLELLGFSLYCDRIFRWRHLDLAFSSGEDF